MLAYGEKALLRKKEPIFKLMRFEDRPLFLLL